MRTLLRRPRRSVKPGPGNLVQASRPCRLAAPCPGWHTPRGSYEGKAKREMPADPELLTSVPFFQTLDADERAAVSALMREEMIAAGTTVFREADSGGILYIISRGKI